MAEYDSSFYDTLNDAGDASAAAILPLVVGLVSPTSAVDIGCGTGIWANELLKLGVPNVAAIDGDYLPRDQMRVAAEHFRPVDLATSFDLGEVFDLAVCVEVAEHLEASRASGFVADLCRSATALVFSAATPKQGGTHHVNEQWLDYWISRFAEHGYTCWDVIRPRTRYDPAVAWIYRQNVMLVLGPAHPLIDSMDELQQLRVPEAGDVSFDYVARYIVEREDGVRHAVKRAINRRIRRMR